eukprot:scaffold260312_cov15-Tisochrysis_lutea.AAC.1
MLCKEGVRIIRMWLERRARKVQDSHQNVAEKACNEGVKKSSGRGSEVMQGRHSQQKLSMNSTSPRAWGREHARSNGTTHACIPFASCEQRVVATKMYALWRE